MVFHKEGRPNAVDCFGFIAPAWLHFRMQIIIVQPLSGIVMWL
jgi:hypothetical protein